MHPRDLAVKRVFDFIFSFLGLLFLGIPIIILIVAATIDTKQPGVFTQQRIGKNAKRFIIYKIRTIKKGDDKGTNTFKEVLGRENISKLGKWLRKSKLDETPQLFNILLGQMSFVGPRPDIEGFADKLEGEDRIILSIKPGLTGPASLYFHNEEELLKKQNNPTKYNREIIWVKKIELNKAYIRNYSLQKDIYYLFQTIMK